MTRSQNCLYVLFFHYFQWFHISDFHYMFSTVLYWEFHVLRFECSTWNLNLEWNLIVFSAIQRRSATPTDLFKYFQDTLNVEEQGFRISNQLLSKSFDNKYVLADQVQFSNYLSGIGENQLLSKSVDDRCVLGDQVQ